MTKTGKGHRTIKIVTMITLQDFSACTVVSMVLCYHAKQGVPVYAVSIILCYLAKHTKGFNVGDLKEMLDCFQNWLKSRLKLLRSSANNKKELLNIKVGTSLVAQWLRIHLPMQGTRVRSLVREDPTCHGATKPMRHNYEPMCHNYWSPRA